MKVVEFRFGLLEEQVGNKVQVFYASFNHSLRVGLDDPQRSLPTPIIL